MDVLLGSENVNPIEKELGSTINGSFSHNDTEAFFQQWGNSPQENEVRKFIGENTIPRQHRLLGSMEIFSNEMIMRLWQEMDSFLSVMHSHIYQ